MLKRNLTIVFGALFLGLALISCANHIEPKLTAQTNENSAKLISNRNSTPENKVEMNSNARAENNNPVDKIPVIKPSNIREELEKKKKANPNLSAKELAEFGNDLIQKKGFDFDVDVADLVEKKLKSKETKTIAGTDESDSAVSFNHSLTLADGTKKTFNLTAPGEESCCCGYYYASFPVSQITDKQFTIISDDKPFVIKRTKEIAFSQEHVLVDTQTIKKEIRKWQVPLETEPFGISEDGSKLYIEDESELLLEISENGTLRFVPKDAPNIISNGKDLREFPTPKVGEPIYKSGESGIMKFTNGSKTYLVAFQYVCT